MKRHLTLPAAAILVAFLQAPPAAAQSLPWQLCNDTAGNYTEGSVYQANIRRLEAALPATLSVSPALFTTGTAGVAPDVVYALALCRADTRNTSSCASCVKSAFQNAQQLCALNKVAAMYDDPCTLRYADWDFLTNVTDNRGMFVAWSFDNVSSSAAAAFYAAASRLINATAEYAATDAVWRFGTGETAFDDKTYPKIYALAQCTPDMSAADCRTCLGDIIRMMTPKYFTGKHGGRVFGVRCTFRFETYPFFNGHPLVQLLPGPPPASFTPPATSSQGELPANFTPPATTQGTRHRTRLLVLAITVPLAAASVFALAVACFCFQNRTTKYSGIPYSTTPHDILSAGSLLLDLSKIRTATDNFSDNNKLGEGGFGAVYKGVMSDGQEIAVKRLSLGSKQGVQELKTELVLVAKLQHRNLVRLIGVCVEEDEKLLVYEYMPNRSLDTILFDSQQSKELDWGKRLKIIGGVARGLQDLKPSNVLLDFDYNPKISDFGLAKLVNRDQTQGVTHRIAGTYGYMAPEYAMHGQYSVKSDVFSLGVLILEIITGRKNSSSYANSEESFVLLMSLVWEHWTAGTSIKLLDPFLSCQAPQDQVLKLVNIGLLCVQDNPVNRPMISTVNVMLGSDSISLQAPSRPTFCIPEVQANFDVQSKATASQNEST
ncbi:hypothetical protein EJB05_32911, partial [Eragrostis curvula]